MLLKAEHFVETHFQCKSCEIFSRLMNGIFSINTNFLIELSVEKNIYILSSSHGNNLFNCFYSFSLHKKKKTKVE